MSHRSIEAKRRHKVAKAFRQKLPVRFDLIQWMLDHGHARTKREARQIILDKRVKSESHAVGVFSAPTLQRDGSIKDEDHVDPYPDIQFKSNLVVSAA
jgi:hypothetical protein